MRIQIPSPLRSYTNNQSQVEAEGRTVRELLDHLEKEYPGLRFRMIDEQDGIRTHIKIFKDSDMVTAIDTSLEGTGVVHIICALSGG